jgi:threonine/homoserine/homoserine lactone efflux protein
VHLSFFIKGLIIGFSIAAPVGPIGLLCIRRTLVYGRLSGFVSGLGAATADTIYGSIAAFGLTFASNFLTGHHRVLDLAGGLFLLYLGVRTLLKKPSQEKPRANAKGLATAYGSTFFLTLTNPLTIVAYVAVFAGLGLAGAAGNHGLAAAVVLGVFLGSTVWWFILSVGAGMVRERLTVRGLRWVNIASGAIISAVGVLALLEGI